VSVAQMTYNVWAAAVGIPFRGLFNDSGQIQIDLMALALTLLVFSIALLGVARRPRALLLIALVPACNVLLGFMLYRERNLLAGVCGLAILFGVGLSVWQRGRHDLRLNPAIQMLAACLMVGALGFQVLQTRALVSQEVEGLLTDDPCRALINDREIGKRFAPIVKQRYGLSNPTCKDGN
jgi:hypothetical protein